MLSSSNIFGYVSSESICVEYEYIAYLLSFMDFNRDLLDMLEVFFSQGTVTTLIAEALAVDTRDCTGIAGNIKRSDIDSNFDSIEGIESYRNYKEYTNVIDVILNTFIEYYLQLDDSSKTINDEAELTSSLLDIISLNSTISMNSSNEYLCLGYINAAMDYKSYINLKRDTYTIAQFEF